MKNLRVAIAQIAPRLGDTKANAALHIEKIEMAAREGADLIVFPELSLTGYLLRDQVPDVAVDPGGPLFRKLRNACRKIDAVIGFVEESPGHLFYNSAAYLARGRKLHIHRKLYLPTYGMFDERRDFAPGDVLRTFKSRFGNGGILICEDAWHPTSAWLLAQDGAEIIFLLSSGPSRGARKGRGITSVAVWRELSMVTAQFQTAFVVYVNRVGFEDGLNFGGGSTVADPFGRQILKMEPLEEDIGICELDGEVLRRARTVYPLLRDERIEMVYREIGRIRQHRYSLPDDHSGEDNDR